VRKSVLVAVGLILGFATSASAQGDRYELGRRLKQFEAAWEAQPDKAARQRALAIVPRASTQFLSLQLGDASRTLDLSRLALATDKPIGDDALFPESLGVFPLVHVIAPGRAELILTVKPVYPVKATLPPGLVVKVTFAGRTVELKPTKFPAKLAMPLDHVAKKGTFDGQLEIAVETGKQVVKWTVGVSQIENLEPRLRALKEVKLDPKKLESLSVSERVELLTNLAGDVTQETDFPAAALLEEAETILQLQGKPYYTAERSGQFRLAVPVGPDEGLNCRLFVPKGLTPKKPVPIVIALHGAGGSENLFFEGYGGGHIVKECEKRGWLLVAPRCGLAFLGGPPAIPALVQKLAERYPIDANRVFLVGHSMGAGQAVELVQKDPGNYAGLATLGGVGRIRKPEVFAKLPTFIGVGTKDFALVGSRSLYATLVESNAKNVIFKEYPDLEHLLIVREALPEVFAMFDKLAKTTTP